MKKKIAAGIGGLLLAVPVFASAAVITGHNDQLVALYQQLISILQQQLLILKGGTHASLAASATSGRAPFTVEFTLANRTDTEAVDFGDGSSTGSAGCKLNTKGHCDLSTGFSHTYALPGTYTVSLYESLVTEKPLVVKTMTITVTQ